MDLNSNTVNTKANLNCKEFQDQADNVLIRHKSILDVSSKLNEYNTRINRAVAKSVTNCGCIEIHAMKQDYNQESLEAMKDNMKTHVTGKLCPNCREVIEQEIGSYQFYIASLCNILNIELSDAFTKEFENMKTLGIYSLK